MTELGSIINAVWGLLWFVLILYWITAAFSAKRNIKAADWRRSAGVRLLFIVIVIILLILNSHLHWYYLSGHPFSIGVQGAGLLLCLIGVAIAAWARLHLGRNWSATPSMKEGHELVTSGPYRFVRHPIYTGIITAAFGSIFIGGMVWLAIFVVMAANFLYRIPVEEGYMMHLFPSQYPEYKKRTKALVPFVW
ncbi:isoprenylcysteine carboxylmethyltransferase family protein [Candidatus Parcubacteria bacterium]|nr:isoprenylcysteine carboxylmethyltransferase family protein [Candidatus Parcubacteria bacterium]